MIHIEVEKQVRKAEKKQREVFTSLLRETYELEKVFRLAENVKKGKDRVQKVIRRLRREERIERRLARVYTRMEEIVRKTEESLQDKKSQIESLLVEANTFNGYLVRLCSWDGEIHQKLNEAEKDIRKLDEAIKLIEDSIKYIANLEVILKKLEGVEEQAIVENEGKGTPALTKVYGMSKRFLDEHGMKFNLFSSVTKPKYKWNDYDKIFMQIFFPEGVSKTLYLIHTTSSKFVYGDKNTFNRINKHFAIFFMYLNPQLLVDPKTIVRAMLILKSHADYFATKVQHKAQPGDNAATILVTEREIDMFGLRNQLKRYQPNEPDAWSISADALNRNKVGKHNLMSYMVNETDNYFRHDIEDMEMFIRKFLKLLITYRLKVFFKDEQLHEKLFNHLSFLAPEEQSLAKVYRSKLIESRSSSRETKLKYVLNYLEEFVRQGYIAENDWGDIFGISISQKVHHLWDSIASHLHKEQPVEVDSLEVLKKVEVDHTNYLKNLFQKNLFELMLSYYKLIYPKDEDKARVVLFLKFDTYFRIADKIRVILAIRINDRWKVPSGEEIVSSILYESLVRYGSPTLLINYYSELAKRENEFKETFDFGFPDKLARHFRDNIYPEFYKRFKENKSDPIIQLVSGQLNKKLLHVFKKFEDLHCLNYLFGIPRHLSTHQKKLILGLLECFKREELPTGKELKDITKDRVLFPKRVKFTTCQEQGFDTSKKSVYGLVREFLDSNPDYLELITRLGTLYQNALKFEVELRRNSYLDIKDIRSTTIDKKTKIKMRNIFDKTYDSYVQKSMRKVA